MELIAVIPERERIVDNLKSKIKLKCIDEKPKIEYSRSNVFKVQSTEKKVFCYNCGKPNHKKKDCRFRNNSNYTEAEYFLIIVDHLIIFKEVVATFTQGQILTAKVIVFTQQPY